MPSEAPTLGFPGEPTPPSSRDTRLCGIKPGWLENAVPPAWAHPRWARECTPAHLGGGLRETLDCAQDPAPSKNWSGGSHLAQEHLQGPQSSTWASIIPRKRAHCPPHGHAAVVHPGPQGARPPSLPARQS